MGKGNSKPTKKSFSEGKAIAVAVLLVTAGVIGAYYLIKWVLEIFLPGLM